ncbi:MAG TPA: CAP domain-containing protein [Myxococcales bacterium]|nr:CAP domain-containing protein [Myxococcales bacterium]
MQPFWPILVASVPFAGPGTLPDQRALEKALRESVAVACPSVTLAIDPDLSRAAQAFVNAVRAGRAPVSGPALAFFAAIDSYEPTAAAGIAKVSPPGKADRAVGDLFSRECHFNRAGVAAASLAGKEAVVALLTAAHATELNRLPGEVQPGTALEIDATLAPGLSAPRLFLLRPGGVVDEQRVSFDGRRVRGTVTLSQRGEYTIELLATGAGGPQVTAIRRVFAGVPPPDTPPKEDSRGDNGIAAVDRAIGRLRAAHGLPPVHRDPALDRVADGHSREMARTRTFAHVLPSDGSMGDRLHKIGYAYQVAGENIGLSVDALSAHEAVAASPAHLANLLDPHYRRLGLGAVVGFSPDGAEGVYLTEVLAAPIEQSPDPQGEVARLLQQKRRTLRLAPLIRDPGLDALATKQVRALVSAGELSTRLQRDVVEEALRRQPHLRGAVAEAFVGSGARATDASRNVADREWTKLGVGAVYANSDVYGAGRLWVLLVYAR